MVSNEKDVSISPFLPSIRQLCGDTFLVFSSIMLISYSKQIQLFGVSNWCVEELVYRQPKQEHQLVYQKIEIEKYKHKNQIKFQIHKIVVAHFNSTGFNKPYTITIYK